MHHEEDVLNNNPEEVGTLGHLPRQQNGSKVLGSFPRLATNKRLFSSWLKASQSTRIGKKTIAYSS